MADQHVKYVNGSFFFSPRLKLWVFRKVHFLILKKSKNADAVPPKPKQKQKEPSCDPALEQAARVAYGSISHISTTTTKNQPVILSRTVDPSRLPIQSGRQEWLKSNLDQRALVGDKKITTNTYKPYFCFSRPRQQQPKYFAIYSQSGPTTKNCSHKNSSFSPKNFCLFFVLNLSRPSSNEFQFLYSHYCYSRTAQPCFTPSDFRSSELPQKHSD